MAKVFNFEQYRQEKLAKIDYKALSKMNPDEYRNYLQTDNKVYLDMVKTFQNCPIDEIVIFYTYSQGETDEEYLTTLEGSEIEDKIKTLINQRINNLNISRITLISPIPLAEEYCL